jgi:hypothetical protein
MGVAMYPTSNLTSYNPALATKVLHCTINYPTTRLYQDYNPTNSPTNPTSSRIKRPVNLDLLQLGISAPSLKPAISTVLALAGYSYVIVILFIALVR